MLTEIYKNFVKALENNRYIFLTQQQFHGKQKWLSNAMNAN